MRLLLDATAIPPDRGGGFVRPRDLLGEGSPREGFVQELVGRALLVGHAAIVALTGVVERVNREVRSNERRLTRPA